MFQTSSATTAATLARRPGRAGADSHLRYEQPIFVCEDGRRARALRFGVRAIATLTALWLAALVAGSIGFARLPTLRWGLGPPLQPGLHISALPRLIAHLPGAAVRHLDGDARISPAAVRVRARAITASLRTRTATTPPRLHLRRPRRKAPLPVRCAAERPTPVVLTVPLGAGGARSKHASPVAAGQRDSGGMPCGAVRA